jgi:RimJ/RimL family protein N-acetyltransferase
VSSAHQKPQARLDRLGERAPGHRPQTIGAARHWLGPAGRGRGLGTSALHLLSGWAFGPGLRRLSLNVEIENLASQRRAERCGFRREGRLRSHQKLRDGTRADVLVYGLLAGEPSGD